MKNSKSSQYATFSRRAKRLDQKLEQLVLRVDTTIEEFFPRAMDEARLEKYLGECTWEREPKAYSQIFCSPVWDLMERQSKHWRPLFAILMLEALGSSSRPYERLLILAGEMIHTGALIIDDIEDGSTRRRGDQCIHLRYGLDIAINAGNMLYFLPLLLLINHRDLNERQRLRIHEAILSSSVRAHFGQGLDIYWSRNMNPAVLNAWCSNNIGPKILQMYADKTGALIEALAEMVTVVADADADLKAACIHLARHFGVSFQIVDDTLDFSESPECRGAGGEDLIEGKLTYVIARAIQSLPAARRKRLGQILCDVELRRSDAGLNEGIDLVRRSGALKACRREAEDLFRAAWRSFTDKVPASESRLLLERLCLQTLHMG